MKNKEGARFFYIKNGDLNRKLKFLHTVGPQYSEPQLSEMSIIQYAITRKDSRNNFPNSGITYVSLFN